MILIVSLQARLKVTKYKRSLKCIVFKKYIYKRLIFLVISIPSTTIKQSISEKGA